MRLVRNTIECKCNHCGMDIYHGNYKFINERLFRKNRYYCAEHGRIKSLHDGLKEWLKESFA